MCAVADVGFRRNVSRPTYARNAALLFDSHSSPICWVFLPSVFLRMMSSEDEKGLDEKVLAVPEKDPRFNHMTSLRDVPEHVLREITNFFEVLFATSVFHRLYRMMAHFPFRASQERFVLVFGSLE